MGGGGGGGGGGREGEGGREGKHRGMLRLFAITHLQALIEVWEVMVDKQ
jgi:hypothetical protein